ncbi:MAG: glycogen/starch synthase [Fibrobacter sp.]|nr:glycogen/starch synthase [Fibrobacter sp.]
MNVLVVAPEAGEWNQLSPLAGAVNLMSEASARVGNKDLVYSPFFPKLFRDLSEYSCIFKGIEPLGERPFEVWKKPDSFHYHIRYDEYFDRPKVYGETRNPYADNHLRFSFLASAALTYTREIGFKPDVIFSHDWGGALVSALARGLFAENFGNIPFYITIHNMKYDFYVSEQEIERIGLDRKDNNIDGYEFWGKVSLLKVGLCYAEKIFLPSPGYRDAILHGIAGGMSGFLRHNAHKLEGVQFGVNYRTWDFNIKQKLPIETAKKEARKLLAAYFREDFGEKLVVYCHLNEESGDTSETLATILADITKLPFFIVIGVDPETPEWNYYQTILGETSNLMALLPLDKDYNNQRHLKMALAGSDLLFASQLKEPSASLVLKSLAGGTIPLIGKDVGCASLLDSESENANVFIVDDSTAPDQMLRGMKQALDIYQSSPGQWTEMVRHAYGFRYEWDCTISQYLLTLGKS